MFGKFIKNSFSAPTFLDYVTNGVFTRFSFEEGDPASCSSPRFGDKYDKITFEHNLSTYTLTDIMNKPLYITEESLQITALGTEDGSTSIASESPEVLLSGVCKNWGKVPEIVDE